MARAPQAPLLAEDGPRQLQGVRRPALEVVGQREVRRDDERPRVVADAGARLVSSTTSSRNLDIAGRN